MKHVKSKAEPGIRTIPAGEFKAKCLQLMDEINENKLTLIITKRGKPVMRACPITQEEEAFRPLWGRNPNVRILGDIMSPLDWPDPVEKWERNGWLPNRRKSK